MLMRYLALAALGAGLCWPGLALADAAGQRSPGAPSYALLVASHRPGPGQQSLRFAAHDADRVAEVLTELGGYSPSAARRLDDPSPDTLLATLDELATTLQAHRDRGEAARFLFYYSGHARAQALSLGAAELPLDRLRERLESLPATITVVVLDACQSGAISGVKGVQPASDFSHNSVAGLATQGLVVMASSSGAELSQESEQLQGSYFTHHLVAALRGAADGDADGSVTLAEAYHYAYHQTLIATAATAVGRQHVTLQTELKGKGEMVLSRPGLADAGLSLPAELGGEVLVHREQPRRVVVAEVHKAPGSELRLGLPAGDYTALVRQPDHEPLRCALALSSGPAVALTLEACELAPIPQADPKGGGAVYGGPRWGLEGAIGALWERRGDYARRLEDFGFDPGDPLFADPLPTLSLGVVYNVSEHLSLVCEGSVLDWGDYRREIELLDGDARNQRFRWRAYGLGVRVRGRLKAPGFAWLEGYAEAGGGLGYGVTRFDDGRHDEQERFFGPYLAGDVGVALVPLKHIGAYVQAGRSYAPIIDNLLDEPHDSGGWRVLCGGRVSF